MQLGNVTTDAAKDYGITFARQLYAASLPEDHQNKGITDFDYAVLRFAGMVDSWAQQADQAAATPPPTTDPGGITAEWRPQAIADLNTYRAKLIGILSSMQIDYSERGETVNAAAVLLAKDGVKVIETATAVVAAYTANPGSRADFDLAVKTRWLEIVAPAPAQVKSDFNKYGGNTV